MRSEYLWSSVTLASALLVLALPSWPKRSEHRRMDLRSVDLNTRAGDGVFDLYSLLRKYAYEPVSFEAKLRQQFENEEELSKARKLAREALALSPLEMPRTYATDGGISAWDFALDLLLAEYAETHPAGSLLRNALQRLNPLTADAQPALLALREVVQQPCDEEALAQALFCTASRLATHAGYRDNVAELVEIALLNAVHPPCKVLLALAVVQLDAAAHPTELKFSSLAAWSAALATCPSELMMRCELARALDFLRRGDAPARQAARADLLAWRTRFSEAPRELAALSVHAALISLLAEQRCDEIAALIDGLPENFSTEPACAAALVMAANEALDRKRMDALRKTALIPRIQHIAVTCASRIVATAAHGVLAENANLLGEDEQAKTHWALAAEASELALTRAASQSTPWRFWDLFGAPPLQALDSGEIANTATWVVALRAFEQRDWNLALPRLESARPEAHLDTSAAETRELQRVHLRAQCLEHLGRIAEARTLRLATVHTPYQDSHSKSEALFAWLDFELGRGEIERVGPSIHKAEIPDELVERAQLYVTWWRAAHEGSLQARALRLELQQRFAEDRALQSRLN